ncbi:MAG: hypothetical protein WHS89_13620, partial [Acidimicrobiales bacterium]
MAPDSLFSRSNQESGGPEDPAEGVRIIDPEEAAEAVERGEVVRRKGQDQPRYGDRPEAPPSDVTPALRFPLADSTDPSTIERPRVAPVEPRVAEGSHEPVLSVEPATGETELPHWTEPPTGEVPRVLIGEASDDEEQQRWTSFASSGTGTPRWRDEHDLWDETDHVSELAEVDTSVGALDTSERLTQEEFLAFDDLQVPEPPSDRPRGSTDDPIRISSSQSPDRGTPRPSSGGRPGGARGAPTERGRAGAGPAAPGGAGRDVPQAVFVGVAIAVVALILFRIGPAATMVLVEAVVVL